MILISRNNIIILLISKTLYRFMHIIRNLLNFSYLYYSLNYYIRYYNLYNNVDN